MKETIKQLEKEIEDLKYVIAHGKDVEIEFMIGYKKDLVIKEAKLQTLKDVCEEIKKWVKEFNAERDPWEGEGQIYDDELEELLKKFQGEEI